MHRMADAQQAMAMFQKLKDAETEHRQQLLQEKREAQRPNDQPPAMPN
jgi:hypothetical protein